MAIINSMGNVGGLIGPALVGYLSEREGGAEAEGHAHALGFMGACATLAGVLALLVGVIGLSSPLNCRRRTRRPPLAEVTTVSL